MRDTILIVDDEADIVSTLEDYFLYNDYNIMTAANGREAIEKAGKQPDLIPGKAEYKAKSHSAGHQYARCGWIGSMRQNPGFCQLSDPISDCQSGGQR